MDLLLQDLHRAARALVRTPAFTLAVIATLALGIGANTAVFSVVNAALLRALPFPESGRVYAVWETKNGQQTNGPSRRRTSSTCARRTTRSPRWRRPPAAARRSPAPATPFTSQGLRVTVDYFRVLGVKPAMGRAFDSTEFEKGRDHVVILSNGAWKERFGGDPAIIGRVLQLNAEGYTVWACWRRARRSRRAWTTGRR